MICVLVVGAGGGWEQAALTRINTHASITVLKRCVDVNDLLAVATLGQADVALVGLDAPGFDAAAVEHLRRHRVRVVGVAPSGAEAVRARAARIGVRSVVAAGDLTALVASLEHHGDDPAGTHARSQPDRDVAPQPSSPPPPPTDRDVAPADPAPDARGGPSTAAPSWWSGQQGNAPVDAPGSSGAAAVTTPRSRFAATSENEPATEPGEVAPRSTTVAVWGPAGAPGRTTLAVTLAATLARRGEDTVLVDGDPWGGAVAQQLGIVDDVSGLLQAARSAAGAHLEDGWRIAARTVERHFGVVTGLPRPERWDEVDAEVVQDLVRYARREAHVVVDTGFSIETDEAAMLAGRPERNGLTLAALDEVDVVLVVGSADPVGLTRLARGVAELRDRGIGEIQVVVNRTRSTLGWSTQQLKGLVADIAGGVAFHLLPEDRAATDRALVNGRHVLDGAEGPLARAVADLAHQVVPVPPGAIGPAGRTEPTARRSRLGAVRRRRADTGRPR